MSSRILRPSGITLGPPLGGLPPRSVTSLVLGHMFQEVLRKPEEVSSSRYQQTQNTPG